MEEDMKYPRGDAVGKGDTNSKGYRDKTSDNMATVG